MAVAKRDYYAVLGVSRDADDEAIRRAFHGLARDWHPDVADAPDAEARFRELAEAYSVLSKRESRLLYDRYGYRGRGNQGFDEALWEARPSEVVRGENIITELEVRSHVLPPPKDPRAVRYLALILLVISVAALAVYVIR